MVVCDFHSRNWAAVFHCVECFHFQQDGRELMAYFQQINTDMTCDKCQMNVSLLLDMPANEEAYDCLEETVEHHGWQYLDDIDGTLYCGKCRTDEE